MVLSSLVDSRAPLTLDTDFLPRARLAGGHTMTLFAWARNRQFRELPAPEARFFDVAPDARVLAHCHWQTDRRARPTLLLLHGLEGSSTAHYMAGMAAKAWTRGFNVVRLNQRNCGGTEHLSRGLYHSGLTADPRFVLTELQNRDGLAAFGVAGYSLGGNIAMKLAAELGQTRALDLRDAIAIDQLADDEERIVGKS